MYFVFGESNSQITLNENLILVKYAMTDSNNFQIVKSRRRRKDRNQSSGKSHSATITELNIPIETIFRNVYDAVNNFRTSAYKSVLLNGLSESLQTLGFESFQQIICYGLGNFSTFNSSKHQLAALVTIKSHYKCNVFIHDPVFTATEIKILKSLEFNIIAENEEGKRNVGDKVSLVVMLHCCKQLMNNFVYANWSPSIQNCILFCNSWLQVSNGNSSEQQKFANYILRIYPYMTEIQLDNNFQYNEPFSDSSLHMFTWQNLQNIPADFWSDKEPLYRGQDLEIIGNDSIKNAN